MSVPHRCMSRLFNPKNIYMIHSRNIFRPNYPLNFFFEICVYVFSPCKQSKSQKIYTNIHF